MSVIVTFNARLGADAEVKETAKGRFIAMRVVLNEYNKAKGENEAVWINVIADASEYNMKMLQYWTKGKLLNFVGTEKVSLYNTKDGSAAIDRTLTANIIEFVSGGKDNNETNTTTQTVSATPTQAPTVDIPMSCGTFNIPQPSTSVPTSADVDDDLPF